MGRTTPIHDPVFTVTGVCGRCGMPYGHVNHPAQSQPTQTPTPEPADMADGLFEPSLPYAGTSGWSGSDTSEARAIKADDSGVTSKRQQMALDYVAGNLARGATVREFDIYLSEQTGESRHHGKASGVLSNLHMDGRIERLSERRDGMKVYVVPEYVNGRETEAQGRNTTPSERVVHRMRMPVLVDQLVPALLRLRNEFPDDHLRVKAEGGSMVVFR